MVLQPHTAGQRGAQGAERGRQDPRPTMPTGEAVLTLAEREVEVAGGTAVTRGPLEACPARALARVTVTVTVRHSGAGTLARCGRGGHTWSRVDAGMGVGRERGWTHAGSPGRRTLGHRTRSRCPGSWLCTGSVPAAGPSGRRCSGSHQRCSRSLGGGRREASEALPTSPLRRKPPFSTNPYPYILLFFYFY